MHPVRLGPYVIDRKIGAGGMGNVYLGKHGETGQVAAIKELPASLAREEGFVLRFNREIEAMRKLDPPENDEEITVCGFVVDRYCPHRQADLSVFGEVDGEILTCTLHGWQFDLQTGECLTATGNRLRVRPATD